MAVVFVEVDVASFACGEGAAFFLTLDRRVAVVDGHVIGDRVIPPVDFVADKALIALLYL